MTQSHFHTINSKDILASIFLLSKKEQREYALNFLVDLSGDNPDNCTTDAARSVIKSTTKYREKQAEAGRRGNEVKAAQAKLAEEERKKLDIKRVLEQNGSLLD